MVLRIGFLALLAAPPAVAATLPVDATGCLHVVQSGKSGVCSPEKSSLKIELTNGCKVPVRAQLCLRGASHVYAACATKDQLAPGDNLIGYSCDADGDYTYWACTRTTGPGNCGGDGLVGKATNAPK